MHPLLYEINTRCWLRELTEDQFMKGVGTAHPQVLPTERGSEGAVPSPPRPITLANVPEQQFEQWRRFGFTHIWLMGAWSTGPRARAQALTHPDLRQCFSDALPDWAEEDVTGSPYAIADYQIAESLGGKKGLELFRAKLHEHGMKLLLDFVPNHLGIDHPWLGARPELFVQSPAQAPETFAQKNNAGTVWLAHGKDPYFPAWTDTVQIDYRRAATQAAMIQLLHSLAEQCDGLRCDMAMLLLKDVFFKTWERFPASADATSAEFWGAAIPAVKLQHPDFLFLAEAYWGLEPRLLSLGFDYTYDKTLYDRLVGRDAVGVQRHLLEGGPEWIACGAHFLENHDEPRIASMLAPAEQRAAALLVLGLPGMRFLHEGQLTGMRRKLPVQLGRRFVEPEQTEIKELYNQILTTLSSSAVGRDDGRLLRPRAAWPENPTALNFMIVQWQADGQNFDLIVVNLAPHPGQCYVALTITDPAGTPAAHRTAASNNNPPFVFRLAAVVVSQKNPTRRAGAVRPGMTAPVS